MANADGSTCSTPQRSASGEDSDSDYENENIRPRGLTGLQNLGNTCYLNSALQSLSNCPPLTRYFLDCPQLIRPEKSPMLSRSYLKLITELWHKKRPSYVVPSGVVTGIKAVHPMFRGYAQQDAQEFLRCLMDQLHEELKAPYSDDSCSEDEDDGGGGNDDDDGSNNANNAGDIGTEQKVAQSETANRRPSFDSQSSQSELDYETCDSGLSSERSSNGGRDNGSSDENNSDSNETSKLKRKERTRKTSAISTTVPDNTDSVANTKEMKETANLLEKKNESETHNRRPVRNRPVMEGGDSREQGNSPTYMPVPIKDTDGQTTVTQPGAVTASAVQTITHQQSALPKTTATTKPVKARKAKNTRYDSIISQTFDGKILSSVRCLNCETVSTTKETFQDLSLPIPSKDHLHMLHSGLPVAGGVNPPKGGTCGEVHQGWLAWMFSWMKSWFIGPTITLQDCLSAFFSADELKGDNMYSCEKCKKLRNGLKYSKVLELPEILSIHLKRFRHEFYSSKISTYISFPLEGLDMEPYLHKGSNAEMKYHKACKNEVTLYDLVAIICHHGTAGGGHYTAYCLNHLNEQWYEFDDQYVTEVDISQVQSCEAYVLFYRKSNRKMESVRQRVMELERNEMSILRFYVSKQWISRFQTFAEPGPITNMDFLCKHGGVPPGKVSLIDDLVEELHQSTWELLYNRFGGGPVCNHLYACKTCHSELEKLRQRQFSEKESFIQLNEEFQGEEHSATVYAISMAWFKEWEAFVREKTDMPPGPIDNSRIIVYKNGQPTLRQTSDHGQLSKDMWLFLHRIYGGGPELIIRQSAGASVKPASSSPTPAQNQMSGAPPLHAVASSSSLSSSPPASGMSQTPPASGPSQTSSTSSATPSVPAPQSMMPLADVPASNATTRTSSSSASLQPASSHNSGDSSDSRRTDSEITAESSQPPQSTADKTKFAATNSGEKDKCDTENQDLNQIPTSSVAETQDQPQVDIPVSKNVTSVQHSPQKSQSMNDVSHVEKNRYKQQSDRETTGSTTQASPAKSVPQKYSGELPTERVHQSLNQLPAVSLPSLSAPGSFTSATRHESRTKPLHASVPSLHNTGIHGETTSPRKFNARTPSSPTDEAHSTQGSQDELKAVGDSLLDSGIGTDSSSNVNDMTACSEQIDKPTVPGTARRSVDSGISTTTNVSVNEENGTCQSASPSPVAEPQNATTSQKMGSGEPKVNQPTPVSSASTGKGKKKGKKGKNMDVTRI